MTAQASGKGMVAMSADDVIKPWFHAFLVASFSGLATGCGSSSALPSDAGAGEVDSGAKCGSVPRLLVDYAREVTDASDVGVQPAIIAVNATDLFYLVTVVYPLASRR